VATLIEIDPARQLLAAEADLVVEFPEVPADDIHVLMTRETKRFAAAKIRDYVSILVARAVRSTLRLRRRTASSVA
jgi:hypothetical protein